MHLAIGDPSAEGLPDGERLPELANPGGHVRRIPPAKGIEEMIEVRLNNCLLGPARVEEGWLVYAVEPW